MLAGNPLRVNVVELRRQVGNQRDLSESVVLDDVALPTSRVPPGAPVQIDLVLEAVSGGVSATGTLATTWDAECRRCLDAVGGELEISVAEVFEARPTEGETYPIDEDSIDLEPMVRELVVLALPVAALCGPDCAGPMPEEFPVVVESEESAPPRDPRWAALDELRLDE